MEQSDCELAFYGQIAEGFLLQEVKENVAELFKAGTEQVERMFTGRRVVIRNKLDLATAEKYVMALRKRGAICQIEKMGAPGEIVGASGASASADSTSQTATAQPASSPPSQQSAPVSSPTQASEVPADDNQHDAYQQSEVKRAAPGRPEAMPLAGERADEVLANVNFALDPVGVNLSEAEEVSAPEFPNLDQISVAPAGSDLSEQKEEPPIPEPDLSHISLARLPDK